MPIFKTDGEAPSFSQAVASTDHRPWDTLQGSPFARSSAIGGFIDALAQRGKSSASSNNSNDVNYELPSEFLDQLLRTETAQLDKNMQYNAEQARITREYNATEAAKLREWQERLSNTSYQRAMRDLEQAGLNPILAFQQGGASVPTGSSASANNASMSTKGGISASDMVGFLSALFKLVPGLAALFAAI